MKGEEFSYKILFGQSEGKRPFGSPVDGRIILKYILRKRVGGCGLD
jgi:hypothetical protein